MTFLVQRPVPAPGALPLFSPEAGGRLEPFAPPFQFTSFFSPEDTLLCVLTGERALEALGSGALINHGPTARLHCVELTAGSGLVGLHLLARAPGATLLGIDVDAAAPPVARRNAEWLGVAERARFARMSVWDAECEAVLAREPIDLLVCNPPYVPEPPGAPLAVEAGAGPDGAAHLRRVAELSARLGPRAVALSWCSVGDPVGVVAAMEGAGYRLDALFAVAIADGEYSGSVQSYLETLPTAFLDSSPAGARALAPDGAARFTYVLLAGVWMRVAGGGCAVVEPRRSAAPAIDRLMRDFADRGLAALVDPDVPFDYRAWVLDRWDEIVLRAMLHGPARDAAFAGAGTAPHAPPAARR